MTSINEKFRVEIELWRFFDGLTVAELARHIEGLNDAGQQPRPLSTIPRAAQLNGSAPASIAQEHLWELHHALPNLPFFNNLNVLRFTSPVDVALLERSINEIIRRHEILRTTFAVQGGQCVQVIAPHLNFALAFRDFKALSRSKKESLAHELLQQEALHSFDLAKGPLIRACLLRLDAREHLLLFSTHQTIFDGWSLRVFVDELVTIYDAFSMQRNRRWRPHRSNLRTSPGGSAIGSQIQKWLRSSDIGESSFAVLCHRCALRSPVRNGRSTICAPRGVHGYCRWVLRKPPDASADKKAAPCS